MGFLIEPKYEKLNSFPHEIPHLDLITYFVFRGHGTGARKRLRITALGSHIKSGTYTTNPSDIDHVCSSLF